MRALTMIFSMCVAMGLSLGVAAQTPKIPVVASFSILGDMTRAIGGEHVQVSALVGPDEDAHTYEPTPDDAKALLNAKIIIKNGLGFEPWLDRLVSSTETPGLS